jgi:ribosomal protein S27E
MNAIESMVCFYGDAPLKERSLFDCSCLDCNEEWIAFSVDYNTEEFECPYCGKYECEAIMMVTHLGDLL